jgi:hypothetical protein
MVSCQEEAETEFEYQASVIGQGMDCGDTFLINLSNLSDDNGLEESTYYADNLQDDFKVEGIVILLNCRESTNSETGVCTTFGPAFQHVYVLEAKMKK